MIDGPALRAIESFCRHEAAKLRAQIALLAVKAKSERRGERISAKVALAVARSRLRALENRGRRAYRRRMAMVI